MHQCLDEFERLMISVGKRDRRTKRARIEFDPSQIENDFRLNLGRLKNRWHSVVHQIFRMLTNLQELDNIAQNILTMFSKTRVNHGVIEVNCRHVLEAIIVPIISTMLDENEINRAGQERQERRKNFIRRLIDLRFDTSVRDSPETSGSSDGSQRYIDVCSTSQNANSVNANPNTRSFHGNCSWESIQILEILLESVIRHSNIVQKNDGDLSEFIYQIINVSHIVDLLRTKFRHIRADIEIDMERGSQCVVDTSLTNLIAKMEEELKKMLEKFEIDNPMSVFRLDLRNLLIQIKILRPALDKSGN